MTELNAEELAAMTLADRAKARVVGPGPYNIPLEFPIAAKLKIEGGDTRDETINSVDVRRPGMKEITDAGDMAAKKGNAISLFWLMSKLTGLPDTVLHNMDPDDFSEVEAVIEVFTLKFQRTAPTSSAT